MKTLEELRYPVGKFQASDNYTREEMTAFMNEISILPEKIEAEMLLLNEKNLDIPYRPGGWTSRQVLHHMADSHMNAYIRVKLTLTEDFPVIKPYMESKWAELPDTRLSDVNIPLTILKAIHSKLMILFETMSDSDFDRKFFHPESKQEFSLKRLIALYAWHGNHHLGHLRIITKSDSK